MHKFLFIYIAVLIIAISSCKKDEELVDNLKSLPDSDRVFYLLNNSQVMKWTTGGEVWEDIYFTFNATRNTPNQAQFATDGLRVYAYANASLYDAEKGAYYNVLSLTFNPSDKAELAVTKNASHILNLTTEEIFTVPHGTISTSTFSLSGAGINSNDIIAFESNLDVVFIYLSDGSVLFSENDGNSWAQTTATSNVVNMGVFSELSAWGNDFYAIDGPNLYRSQNCKEWTKLNFNYESTSVSGDTLLLVEISDVFAEENYINFRLLESVQFNGSTLSQRDLLIESENGGLAWSNSDIDLPSQDNKRILKIENNYVTEFLATSKNEKSIHFSDNLGDWTVIEGSQMFMSNVYQLFKAQTVR